MEHFVNLCLWCVFCLKVKLGECLVLFVCGCLGVTGSWMNYSYLACGRRRGRLVVNVCMCHYTWLTVATVACFL